MAKKELLFLSLALISMLILTSVNAEILMTKEAINDVVAVELTIPAKYRITIENPSTTPDTIEFLVLTDNTILPKQVPVPPKQNITALVTFLPTARVRYDFFYEYFIRNARGQSLTDYLFIKIRPLSEILEVGIPDVIGRNDDTFPIIINNKQNIDFDDVQVFVESTPVISEVEANVPAISKITAEVPLANTRLKVTEAGNYEFKAILQLNNEYNYTIKKTVQLKEYSEIDEENKSSFQFFGYKKTLIRRNNGNIKQVINVDYKYANFLEKTFTNFDVTPLDNTAEKATWQKQLSPGENLTIIADTNYTVPIVIVILIVIAVVAYVIVRRHMVIVSKKAIKIKTKGGEFAVKIVVLLKNVSGHEVNNLTLTDSLPLTTQIYEKFGTVKPDQQDKHRLVWKFPALLPGEEILTSYIIYSKINMVGTIELPRASLSFNDMKGKKHVSDSNKLLVRAG